MTRSELYDYAEGDEIFSAWLEELDKLCLQHWNLSLFDLPDMDLKGAFEAGETPTSFMKSDVMFIMEEEFGETNEEEEDEEDEEEDC